MKTVPSDRSDPSILPPHPHTLIAFSCLRHPLSALARTRIALLGLGHLGRCDCIRVPTHLPVISRNSSMEATPSEGAPLQQLSADLTGLISLWPLTPVISLSLSFHVRPFGGKASSLSPPHQSHVDPIGFSRHVATSRLTKAQEVLVAPGRACRRPHSALLIFPSWQLRCISSISAAMARLVGN